MRVRVYIDGFNLYHSVDELKDDKLKWLDVRKLAAQFLRPNEEIDKVLFFTALPTYLIREARDQVKSQKAAEKIARHRLYIKALEACGTEVNPGTFKAKPAKCYKCKTEWLKHEEKETDVSIGIEIIRDAIQNKFDRALFISGDTDFAPALKMATKEFRKHITLLVPPNRENFNNLSSAATNYKIIKRHHLEQSGLPEEITTTKGGLIQRPDKYK